MANSFFNYFNYFTHFAYPKLFCAKIANTIFVKEKIKGKKAKSFLFGAIGGSGVGIINGFFGAGGGMLAVPLLNKGLKEEVKVSHATAILVILPITIVSSIFYGLNGHFNLQQTLFVGGGVLVGGIIGALLLKKLPAKIVGFVFAILMITAGVRMVV